MKGLWALFILFYLISLASCTELRLNYESGKAYEYDYVSQHVNNGEVKDGGGVSGTKVLIKTFYTFFHYFLLSF